MGYTTDFYGQINIEPPLNAQEREFLLNFSGTRRMDREKGPYYVEGSGFMGQDVEDDVRDHNSPPAGQPGLWCQWIPTDDGKAIEWDGGEKFYDADEWMIYIIEHFIGSNPKAKKELPFLQGHVCNGIIDAQGEEYEDSWRIVVEDNKVRVARLVRVEY